MPIIKNEKFDHDSDLAYERRRGKKCDVKLMLAKRSYNLHSSVLNKESPHFKRELSTKQPNNDGIRVLNVTRHGVGAIDLEKILDYMYGQKLSVSEVGPAIRLMAVTKCFEMSHLEEQILRYLSCLVLDDLVHVSVYCGMLFDSSTRLRLSKVRRNMVRFLAQQLHLPAGDAGNSMIGDQQGVVQTANAMNPTNDANQEVVVAGGITNSTNDAQQEVEPVDHSVNPPADAEQEVLPVGVAPNPTENVKQTSVLVEEGTNPAGDAKQEAVLPDKSNNPTKDGNQEAVEPEGTSN